MTVTARSEHSVRFKIFELDLVTRELHRDGNRIKLRGHPIDVLLVLLERPGELVTREELRKRLWPQNTFVDFEQILNNSVRILRDALGDSTEAPQFIETLPRLGYRFIAPVDALPRNASIIQMPSADASPTVLLAEQSAQKRTTKKWIIILSVLIAIIFFPLASWYAIRPLPSPRITYYEQLTLDGTEKVVSGTDGSRIYLWSAPTGITAIPTSGGRPTEVPVELPTARGRGGSYVIDVSPDGSKLLVGSDFSLLEGRKLWVAGSLGQPVSYLTRAWTGAWSPDGKTVAYATADGDVYTIGINGGEPRLILSKDTLAKQRTRILEMKWSPDGSTIRFFQRGWRMFEVDANGANFHEWLPGWSASALKCCGRWTTDGQFFVFLSGRALGKGPNVQPLAEIWVVDERHRRVRPPLDMPRLLASGPLLWGEPLPSLDGQKIFARGVSQRGELVRYDPGTKRFEPYLSGISAEMLDFSPDGKYVAYVSFPDGTLWRANRDGSAAVQLTQPPFSPRTPQWSPDGSQILFTDNTQRRIDTAYVIPSQGGPPKRLVPNEFAPQNTAYWSPNGKRVIYSTVPYSSFVPFEPSKIETRIVDLGTGEITILPNRPEGFWSARWSPDGRYIAGQSLNARELLIFDLVKQEWKVLPQQSGIGWNIWSHDGKYCYFNRGRGIYRVFPKDNSNEELVLEFPNGFRSAGFYNFWMGLDPADQVLAFRNDGTDEIYSLALETK